ncbi:hypothetical protein [Amycolatopsis sp. cmx-4-61]|uniref:hypothetical protein n=1 Tax=Amycolatopsis sp. cmx-4-61 TaxID=2790937 RepID=UPI00397C1220
MTTPYLSAPLDLAPFPFLASLDPITDSARGYNFSRHDPRGSTERDLRLVALQAIHLDCTIVTGRCGTATMVVLPSLHTWALRACRVLQTVWQALEWHPRMHLEGAPALREAGVELPLIVRCFLATIPRMPAIRDLARRLYEAEASMTALVTVWNRSVAGRRIMREVQVRETRRCIMSLVSSVDTLSTSAECLIKDIQWNLSPWANSLVSVWRPSTSPPDPSRLSATTAQASGRLSSPAHPGMIHARGAGRSAGIRRL